MSKDRVTPSDIEKEVVEHRTGESTLQDDGGKTASGRWDPAQHKVEPGWDPVHDPDHPKHPANYRDTNDNPGVGVGKNSEGKVGSENRHDRKTTDDN